MSVVLTLIALQSQSAHPALHDLTLGQCSSPTAPSPLLGQWAQVPAPGLHLRCLSPLRKGLTE